MVSNVSKKTLQVNTLYLIPVQRSEMQYNSEEMKVKKGLVHYLKKKKGD